MAESDDAGLSLGAAMKRLLEIMFMTCRFCGYGRVAFRSDSRGRIVCPQCGRFQSD